MLKAWVGLFYTQQMGLSAEGWAGVEWLVKGGEALGRSGGELGNQRLGKALHYQKNREQIDREQLLG